MRKDILYNIVMIIAIYNLLTYEKEEKFKGTPLSVGLSKPYANKGIEYLSPEFYFPDHLYLLGDPDYYWRTFSWWSFRHHPMMRPDMY